MKKYILSFGIGVIIFFGVVHTNYYLNVLYDNNIDCAENGLCRMGAALAKKDTITCLQNKAFPWTDENFNFCLEKSAKKVLEDIK